jgi:hypothetical protein
MACNGAEKDYVIRIKHERPELGKGVEFVSTYFAREGKDGKKVEKIFTEAFKSAHPTWVITRVTLEEKS